MFVWWVYLLFIDEYDVVCVCDVFGLFFEGSEVFDVGVVDYGVLFVLIFGEICEWSDVFVLVFEEVCWCGDVGV